MANLIKSAVFFAVLGGNFFVMGCNESTSSIAPHQAKSSDSAVDKNKLLIQDFYLGVFEKHQVKKYADRYLSQDYIQHNPYIATGKQPFIDYFTAFYQQNPKAKISIKRMIAEGDVVSVHAHSMQNDQDKGRAIVDIFRIKTGKIVEHWGVIQPITETNQNSTDIF